MNSQLNAILDAFPYLLLGAVDTALIVFAAMGIGLVIGVLVAVGLVYGPRWLKFLLSVYLWFFRGVPILALLFLFYFGLFSYLNINIPALAAVAVVLGLTTGAYQANIFRGAIMSLPRGQFRAASALGMSDAAAIRSIILPQALRISIPAWSNEYSIILKDSALAFVIGAPEIMARAQFVASRTYQHLPLYLAAGLLYFLLTWAGVAALRKLEHRVHIPGYSREESA